MFNLFKKKTSSLKIIDKIWMSELFKLKAFAEEARKDPSIIFIFWFDETLQKVADMLTAESVPSPSLFPAREITASHITGKRIILAEHYPLAEKENNLFEKLGLDEVTIWSALDEPLFNRFGADKIIQLMKQFGMKENEPIEHNMISKAIRNAQEKIASKVTLEQSARSQKDWLEKNFPS